LKVEESKEEKAPINLPVDLPPLPSEALLPSPIIQSEESFSLLELIQSKKATLKQLPQEAQVHQEERKKQEPGMAKSLDQQLEKRTAILEEREKNARLKESMEESSGGWYDLPPQESTNIKKKLETTAGEEVQIRLQAKALIAKLEKKPKILEKTQSEQSNPQAQESLKKDVRENLGKKFKNTREME
jgi:hypothetical protein